MKPTHDDIKRLFGDLDDHTIAEIEDSGATINELEEVVSFLARQTEVMGDLRRTLSGRSLTIFNLLSRQDRQWDEDR